MKIFIDFDDVIFNTKFFKCGLENLFLHRGIPLKIFKKHYIDPNDCRAIKTFDPWKHAEFIHKNLPFDLDGLNDDIEKFLNNSSPMYIFPDVFDFIEAVGSDNLNVLSFGEQEFQGRKIRNSNIQNHIKNIFITETSKCDVISDLIKSKKNEVVYFIDDRIEQIVEVKKKFPHIITIFLKRPEARYQEMVKGDCCDHEAHDLKEVEKIILA